MLVEKEDLGLSLSLRSSSSENRHPLQLNLMPWNDLFASRGTLMWNLWSFFSPFSIFSLDISRSGERSDFYTSFATGKKNLRSSEESLFIFFPNWWKILFLFSFSPLFLRESLDLKRNPVFESLFLPFMFRWCSCLDGSFPSFQQSILPDL